MRIVGIDPSTSYLGYAVLEVKEKKIVEVSSTTLVAKKLKRMNREMLQVLPEYLVRVFSYREVLVERFKEDSPDMVACESPFFGKMSPRAFAPLVVVCASIREALWLANSKLSVVDVSPSEAKKAIFAKGSASKDEVREKMLQYQLPIERAVLESYDEHSIDAIAVAIGALKGKGYLE